MNIQRTYVRYTWYIFISIHTNILMHVHIYIHIHIYIAELHPSRLASRLRYNSWNCVPFADVDGITLSTCLMCSAPSLKTRPSPIRSRSRSPIRSLIRYREVNSPARQRTNDRQRLRRCSLRDAATTRVTRRVSPAAGGTGKRGTNHVSMPPRVCLWYLYHRVSGRYTLFF